MRRKERCERGRGVLVGASFISFVCMVSVLLQKHMQYGDDVGSTVEEYSNVFFLIQMR